MTPCMFPVYTPCMTAGSSEAHTALVNRCLVRLTERGCFVWRHSTGMATAGNRFLPFGLPGSSDIVGMLPHGGRFLAVECKTGNARLGEQQKRFRDRIVKQGGLHVVARSPEDVDEMLNAVEAEIRVASGAGQV